MYPPSQDRDKLGPYDRSRDPGGQKLGPDDVSHKIRLDQLVLDLGLVPSRERARALILAGQVTVNGQAVTKAGTAVPIDAAVALVKPDHPYVGRGGVKLAHALDAFNIDPSGREAVDIGASTGGFTDVMLQRGAARVYAIDVGHGQLDWRLRNDPRVVVREGVNARALSRVDVPGAVDLATIDVSFISLRHIFPALAPLLPEGADIVALVKPQFEAGRAQVGKGGLVTDPVVHQEVLTRVRDEAAAHGLKQIGMTRSPIKGATGNQEFLLHLRKQSKQD